MRIELEKPNGRVTYKDYPTKEQFVDRFSEVKRNWETNTSTRGLIPNSNTLDVGIFHANFLEALEIAWGHHYGVAITPDIIWHTLLSEVVGIVAEDPKKYENLFTETPGEKQLVKILSLNEIMPLEDLMSALKDRVPTNTDIFLPDFTTSNEISRLSRYATFANLVSPYYSYMVLACGIPHIDVLGSQQDYNVVRRNWNEFAKIITGHSDYFFKVSSTIERLIGEIENPNFWMEIFKVERCGSGSEIELYGWWTDLYRNQPSLRKLCNWSTHMSKVLYTQAETKKDFELYHGVLYSTLSNDGEFQTMKPDFGSLLYQRNKKL